MKLLSLIELAHCRPTNTAYSIFPLAMFSPRLRGVLLILLFSILFYVDVSSAGRNYYDVLGLSRGANTKTIKKAYLKLSKEYHPDKNPGNEEANKKFVEVATAYEVLSDDNKRRIYDTQGEEGLKNSGMQQQATNPFDLFGQMFGGGFGFGGGQQQQQQERRGEDVTIDIPVTLADLYLGRVFEVQVKQQHLCPHCRGTGAKSESDVQQCHACQGRGMRVHMHQIAPGFVQQVQQPCDVCGGKGKIVKSKCPVCGGEKLVQGTKTIDVHVERGMADGAKIEFENAADEHPDHAAGHVIFQVKSIPHANFTRQKNDLHLTYHITLLESLVGFEREIFHLDGHVVKIKSNKVTHPGDVQRIKDEGMPLHENASDKGDLLVKFVIDFPVSLSAEQRAGFAQILK